MTPGPGSQQVLEGLAIELLDLRLEWTPAIFYACDPGDGFAVRYISPNVKRLLGYEPRRFREEPGFWAGSIHPDDAPGVFAALSRLVATGTWSGEYRFRHADGRWRWMRDEVHLRRGPGGTPSELYGFWIDITPSRETESALRAANEALEAEVGRRTSEALRLRDIQQGQAELLSIVLDTIPQRVYWKDRALRYRGANEAFLADSGLPDLSALVGREDADLLPAELAAARRAEELRVMESGLPRLEVEMQLDLPRGERGWVRTSKVPMRDARGEVIGLLGTYEDVTDRVRMEEELRRAKEVAEAASQAKSEFLANMSHEIRTPMNGVLGALELALRGEVPARQRELLELAERSAETLLGQLDDLLDLSRIESGRMELEAAPFDLRETVRGTLRTLSVEASSKGLELVLSVAPGVPDEVDGDSGRLRQVLLNLVGNAVKFTPRGRVEVAVELVSERETDSVVAFAVHDTGIGIAEEKLERIFEPFVQADSSMARRFGGTGLGLSISSRLVAMMGGRLTAESRVGAGSTFRFTLTLRRSLPAALRESGGEGFGAVPPPPARPLRVLLAEDNGINRRLATAILEERGHRVTAALNGEEALEALVSGEFDVVLMDVQMPVLDGLTATERLRRREAETGGRRLPVVALTAHAREEDRRRCRTAGMDRVLCKPIRSRDLLAAVEGWGESWEGEGTPAAPAAEGLFDPARALALLGGRDAILRDLVAGVLDEMSRTRAEVAWAHDVHDLAALAAVAHRVKSTAAQLEAAPLQAAATRVERAARAADARAAAEGAEALEAALSALEGALRSWLDAAVTA